MRIGGAFRLQLMTTNLSIFHLHFSLPKHGSKRKPPRQANPGCANVKNTQKRLSVQTEYGDFSWRQLGSLLRIVFDREAVEGGKAKKLRLPVADGDYAPPLDSPGTPLWLCPIWTVSPRITGLVPKTPATGFSSPARIACNFISSYKTRGVSILLALKIFF